MLKDRLKLHPCPSGKAGNCCKGCFMGPCRLSGPDAEGVCGASQELIAAKNLLRTLAAGAAAHCGHAAHLLEFTGAKLPGDYLKNKAPGYLYKAWKAAGILPGQGWNSCFKEISEALHASAMGVSADPHDLLKRCLRTAIVDGYHGMYAATGLEDARFGAPKVRGGTLDLGCLSADKVNIAVHGHEPALAEAMADEAARRGANLVGVCCTGVSLLSRRGIPLAAHFTLQEDIVATGMVEAMVVDSQCVMPSLSDLCECYHTRLITTSPLARMPGAVHLPVRTPEDARAAAKKAVAMAIAARRSRKRSHETAFRRGHTATARAVAGFSEGTVDARGIASRLRSGELKGVIAAVGCVNPRTAPRAWVKAFRELGSEYLILTTGCMAFELGRHGLLDGKSVLHMGSCVNNARIAGTFARLAGLCGKRISEMPLMVSCPMPMTEKSAAIGFFFAALGCAAHFGGHFPAKPGSAAAVMLGGLLQKECGGELILEPDPRRFMDKARDIASRRIQA